QQATQEYVKNACHKANIHVFIIGLPDGYETHVGGKGIQLSDGQKFWFQMAIQKALDTAAAGRTTLATHRLSTIQHVDIIFVKG
ncbi:2433_t:CDS:2, partial [Gigaspora rosea]